MQTNIEKLGATLNKRMQQAAKARTGITAELGTITSDRGLQVASLGNVIPKGDYLISSHLTGRKTRTVSTSKEDNHTHSVDIHSELRNLAPGNRVLVIWCENEPVVVDILITS